MAFVCVSFDFAQDHELVEWHRFEAASRLVFVRPALVRRDLRFKPVLLNTASRDSMKSTAKPGLPAIRQPGLDQIWHAMTKFKSSSL
jgi:hypothetical protein